MFTARALDRHRLSLAFLSGLMLAASFPKLNLAWLAWIAPGLTLFLGAGQSGKKVFCVGFLAGLGRYLVSLYWFLLIPMPACAIAAWLAMCLVLALFVATWSWVCWRILLSMPATRSAGNVAQREPEPRTLGSWRALAVWPAFCAAAWVAMEMGFAHVLTGFAWNLLGASQYRFLPLIQIACVTGVYGVSFVTVWVSTALAAAVWQGGHSQASLRAWAPFLALPLGTLLAACWVGLGRLAPPEPEERYLKIALVQPSTPQHLIWDANERTNRLNDLLRLSRKALAERADLLVWPEAALPGTLARTRATQDIVTDLVRAHNIWMIFGAEDSGRRTAPDGTEVVDRFNAAFFVNPAGDLLARYYKRHLVAFGEYMPGARWLPFLKRFREEGGGFARGKGPVAFQMERPRGRISTLICFEDVFPHLAREHVDADTDLLLNLTNNGWFGESAAQWQHAISALFRALENGVPLVRCTNNGLSCWIDAQGRMHEVYFPGSRNIYQAGFKVASIPLRGAGQPRARTFYNRYGDLFGWSCVAVTGLALTGSFRPARRESRPS